MKVASINFEIRKISEEREFISHITEITTQCADLGATLIVLPEYTVAELFHLVPKYEENQAPSTLTKFADNYVKTIRDLANKLKATIIGGSFFKEEPDGIYNICPVSSPNHPTVFQVKNCLTAYERDVQKLNGGNLINALWDKNIGALICYDCEFPQPTTLLCKDGMQVLCVPSSTETVHGFRRVRNSCLARAIEHQIFVIQSCLVGSIGKEPHPESYGQSAIIAPCSPEFPNGPILNESLLNKESIAIADLDFSALEHLRNNGEVTNWKDTNEKKWIVKSSNPSRDLS